MYSSEPVKNASDLRNIPSDQIENCAALELKNKYPNKSTEYVCILKFVIHFICCTDFFKWKNALILFYFDSKTS